MTEIAKKRRDTAVVSTFFDWQKRFRESLLVHPAAQKNPRLFVLGYILSDMFDWQNFDCHPSRETLAEKLGVTVTQVSTLTKELANIEFIRVKRRRNTSAVYVGRMPQEVKPCLRGRSTPGLAYFLFLFFLVLILILIGDACLSEMGERVKSKQDDFGYWAGWVVAFTIAAAFFVYVVWQAPSLQSLACGTDETDCFRQWLSALGGWAALAAAVPSVLYLAKQIAATDQHHKRSVALQLSRNRNLALHVSGYSRAMRKQMEARRSRFASGDTTAQDALAGIKFVEDVIFQFHFREFEEEIEIPAMSLAFIRNRIDLIGPVISTCIEREIWGVEPKNFVIGLFDITIKYLKDCDVSGERYLQITDQYAINVLSEPSG